MSIQFQIEATDGPARVGHLTVPHGVIDTPVFMPVGTLASVKGVPQDVLEELGVEILLSNTYHLYLRPGVDTIRQMGGLHGFMSWHRAILTDSGGFQVFSLSELRKIKEEGVTFRSHLDGGSHFFSPESAMAAQIGLGADIIMAFDECTEYPAERERARASMEMTLRWAERSKRYFEEHKEEVPWTGNAHVGRTAHVGTAAPGCPAERSYANADTISSPTGVGEPRELTREIVESTLEHLPADKPRYLMGVGTPEEIDLYARMGVDMMDCVLPTRAARHGLLFTSQGKVSIKQARHAQDEGPVDPNCGCRVCSRYSRAYLRHLYASNELLGQVLNTIHNVSYYLDTMRAVRHSIQLGERARFLSERSGPKP